MISDLSNVAMQYGILITLGKSGKRSSLILLEGWIKGSRNNMSLLSILPHSETKKLNSVSSLVSCIVATTTITF